MISRRSCLVSATVLPAAALLAPRSVIAGQPTQTPQSASSPAPPSLTSFPSQDPEQVREIVGASHGNIEKVTAMLKEAPRLANATYDWGFGDWETCLGAASHTGRLAIAQLLLEYGARPDIFAFAMLGKLDAVKAMVEAQPGIQRTRGPHGLTLLHHARAGGEQSSKVVEYLSTLGDADIGYTELPLSTADGERFLGTYAYATQDTTRFAIAWAKDGKRLTIQREGGVSRAMFYRGDLKFHPVGAPECIIAFSIDEPRARRVTITTPAQLLSAERV